MKYMLSTAIGKLDGFVLVLRKDSLSAPSKCCQQLVDIYIEPVEVHQQHLFEPVVTHHIQGPEASSKDHPQAQSMG